jgi:hypothetical protein
LWANLEDTPMIKHIVFWKLKDEAEGASKAENARKMKAKLEALAGRIPTLKHIEVGLNFEPSDAAADVVLYSEFTSKADLDAYQTHPEHVAAGAFVRSVVMERRVADYEI